MSDRHHAPGCVLDPVHWLRHAIAAGSRLASDDAPANLSVDRVSAEALTETLAHYAELAEWASVTLQDVARSATLMNLEIFDAQCTCGLTVR